MFYDMPHEVSYDIAGVISYIKAYDMLYDIQYKHCDNIYISSILLLVAIIILTAAATKVFMCIVHNNKICKHA